MKTKDSTILVVDDEEGYRFLLTKALRKVSVAGTIQEATDGAEAVAYLEGRGKFADRSQFGYPRIIFCDLKMPKADGFVLLEHLRKNPDRGIVPVVILSSSDDAGDVRKAYLLGAHTYHMKPTTFDALERLVRIVFDYWQEAELPEEDFNGKRSVAENEAKPGRRTSQS